MVYEVKVRLLTIYNELSIMRYILLINIVCVLSLTGLSQDYDSMIVENKEWAVMECIYNYDINIGWYEIMTTTNYKFKGDTIINNKTYNKLYSSYVKQPWQLTSFFREDSSRVFEYIFNEEVLLYDFSLLPGDSICFGLPVGSDYCYYTYTDSVDIITVNGKPRKRIIWWDDIWIEGIGSIYMPFEPLAPRVDRESILLCCHINNELIYKNSDYDTCYLSDIGSYSAIKPVHANGNNNFIKVEPNPFSDYTQININKNIGVINNKLLIINLHGNICKETYLTNNSLYLYKDNLTAGLYIILLFSDKGEIYTQKLVIQK